MGKNKEPIVVESLSASEQATVLKEAQANIVREAWYMKRCLDSNKLMDALKHASTMIGELRESRLSPKNYYELYISAFDELRYLESFLCADEKVRGRSLSELYELVQYAGNILPRLYLMVTVGSVYIKEREAPAKEVLRDLVEMCRGVQHPTRGLFLRNYLSEMTKDKLPDIGSEYEGTGGSVQHSIYFTLQNFVEMNKLWVRMQHQGPVKEREAREAERKELRLLVGKNLARLSQLEGVDGNVYERVVLGRVLEQITGCRDQIAQHYLMEVLIQVFPDEYHLRTLPRLLTALGQLLPTVNVRAVLCALMDRLCAFATRTPSAVTEDIDIFETFFKHSQSIIEKFSRMPPVDVLAILGSLMRLTLAVYPERRHNVDALLGATREHVERIEAQSGTDVIGDEGAKELVRIIRAPLDAYETVVDLLSMDNFAPVIGLLGFRQRKLIAVDVVKAVLRTGAPLASADMVKRLFAVIGPLLADEEGQDALDEEENEEEQGMVAGLVNLFQSPNPEEQFVMFGTARKVFGQGGTSRVRYTLVPLVFGSLQLVTKLRHIEAERQGGEPNDEWSKGMATMKMRIFKFVHETITALVKCGYKEDALRLFLQAATVASTCRFDHIAYEFVTQVWEIYERDIADSSAQFRALSLIIGTVRTLDVFSAEDFDAFVTKTAIHAGRLIRKPDQCRAVYMSAHLFWVDTPGRSYRDSKRVLECLQRSLKIAAACVDQATNVALFAELLNEYLYFFEAGNELVVVKFIKTLVALIDTNLKNIDGGVDTVDADTVQATKAHYRNTLRHIAIKRSADPNSPYASMG